MPFEKGRTKTGGRAKGTPNKSTRTVIKMLRYTYAEELSNLPEVLEKLDPKDRVNAFIKLSQLLIPRIQSIGPDFDQTQWDLEF